MHSMTGFGQARGAGEGHGVTVSLRAVNSRHLDLNLRLGDELRASEAALRELLGGALARGRVDVSVEIQPVAEPQAEVSVRGDVVRALATAVSELVEEGLVSGALTLGDLVRLPEAVEIRPVRDRWQEADEALLLEVARQALDELLAARRQEGERLAEALEERRLGLAEVAQRLDTLRHTARQEAEAALRRRLDALLGETPVDEARLAQEAAVLVDRSDVSEEIDRLRAHLDHFRDVAADDGAVGKRLDFLTQEILRELNTVGAKCRHAEVTRAILDGKVLCEQLREQLQNVE